VSEGDERASGTKLIRNSRQDRTIDLGHQGKDPSGGSYIGRQNSRGRFSPVITLAKLMHPAGCDDNLVIALICCRSLTSQ
jgi:hypothetical protein